MQSTETKIRKNANCIYLKDGMDNIKIIYVEDVAKSINNFGYVFLANVMRKINQDTRENIEFILEKIRERNK